MSDLFAQEYDRALHRCRARGVASPEFGDRDNDGGGSFSVDHKAAMYAVEIVILFQLDNVRGVSGRVNVTEGTGHAACRHRARDQLLACCTRGFSREAVYLFLPFSSRVEECSRCMCKRCVFTEIYRPLLLRCEDPPRHRVASSCLRWATARRQLYKQYPAFAFERRGIPSHQQTCGQRMSPLRHVNAIECRVTADCATENVSSSALVQVALQLHAATGMVQ